MDFHFCDNVGSNNRLRKNVGEVLVQSGRRDAIDIASGEFCKFGYRVQVALIARDRDNVDGDAL